MERKPIERLFARLKRQPSQSFPRVGDSLVAPSGHGVYVIRDRANKVVHVGRTIRGPRDFPNGCATTCAGNRLLLTRTGLVMANGYGTDTRFSSWKSLTIESARFLNLSPSRGIARRISASVRFAAKRLSRNVTVNNSWTGSAGTSHKWHNVQLAKISENW